MGHDKNYNYKITIFGQDFKDKEVFIIEGATEREAIRIAKSDPRVIEAERLGAGEIVVTSMDCDEWIRKQQILRIEEKE